MFVFSSLSFDCLYINILDLSALQGYRQQGCVGWISGGISTRHAFCTTNGFVYTRRVHSTCGCTGSADVVMAPYVEHREACPFERVRL